jgi:hypothetical protein
MYVARDLVPAIQEALENGRRAEALLVDCGEALLHRLREDKRRRKRAGDGGNGAC